MNLVAYDWSGQSSWPVNLVSEGGLGSEVGQSIWSAGLVWAVKLVSECGRYGGSASLPVPNPREAPELTW